MAPTSEEWIRALAARLGVVPPDGAAIDALLAMAGIAAHASERTAAPISTWMAAGAGMTPTEALEVAKALAAEL